MTCVLFINFAKNLTAYYANSFVIYAFKSLPPPYASPFSRYSFVCHLFYKLVLFLVGKVLFFFLLLLSFVCYYLVLKCNCMWRGFTLFPFCFLTALRFSNTELIVPIMCAYSFVLRSAPLMKCALFALSSNNAPDKVFWMVWRFDLEL